MTPSPKTRVRLYGDNGYREIDADTPITEKIVQTFMDVHRFVRKATYGYTHREDGVPTYVLVSVEPLVESPPDTRYHVRSVPCWTAIPGTTISNAAQDAVGAYRGLYPRPDYGYVVFNEKALQIGESTQADDLIREYWRRA